MEAEKRDPGNEVGFSHVNDAVIMLISRNFHIKRSEVSIKTRSTPASLSLKGQATKHTTVKWSIASYSFCKNDVY